MITDLLAVVRFDFVQIGILQERAEKLDKLFLFFGAVLAPLGTERAFSHLGKIEPPIDHLFEFSRRSFFSALLLARDL